MKKLLNLFDEPLPELPEWAAPVGSPQDIGLLATSFHFLNPNELTTAVSLDLATESIVLLENNGSPIIALSQFYRFLISLIGVLPLSTDKKVLLVGPSANSTKYLCGGWTIHWQGAVSDDEFVANASTTIYSGSPS